MKSAKTYLIVFLALTSIGGSILAWQQYSELVELRAAAMNTSERADLQKRVWELEKLNKQLRDQSAIHPSSEDTDAMLSAITGEKPTERRDRQDGRAGRGGDPMQQFAAIRDLMSKPEVQALMSSQQKAAVEARYAALFKSLNLAPEQTEKLKSILADRQTTMQDVFMAAREQGIDPRTDRDSFQKLMEVARTDINSSIKSVIGENGFAQFESYEKTLPQRNVVNQLQQRLSYSDTPLSSTQADQLVQILAANTPAPVARPAANAGAAPIGQGDRAFILGGGAPGAGISPGGRGTDGGALGAILGGAIGGGGGLLNLGGGGAATAPITSTAVSQAQAVLAGPQVAALQQLQQQQQNQQQLAKIFGETLAAQNGANNAGNGAASTPARPAGALPSSPVKKPGG
jgi:hypothetical protein